MRAFIPSILAACFLIAGCDRYVVTQDANAELRAIVEGIRTNKPGSLLVRVDNIGDDTRYPQRVAYVGVNTDAGIAVLQVYRSTDRNFSIYLSGVHIRGEITKGRCAAPPNEEDYHPCPPYSDAGAWQAVYDEMVALVSARGAKI